MGCAEDFDAGCAERLPAHPHNWSDGSLVPDRVSSASSAGSGMLVCVLTCLDLLAVIAKERHLGLLQPAPFSSLVWFFVQFLATADFAAG